MNVFPRAHAPRFRFAFLTLLLPLAGFADRPAQPAPPEVLLAADGKARLSVVVSARASERVRRAARTLADYLGRIGGATFPVAEGDGRQGVAVGLPGDFPIAALQNLWDARDPTRSEDY